MAIIKTILASMLMIFSVSAWAHTGLASSSPANKEALDNAPEQIVLKFKGPVHLLKLKLSNDAEQDIDIDFKPSAKAAKRFAIDLPKLEAGGYKANWSIMSEDGHKIGKTFSFSINSD